MTRTSYHRIQGISQGGLDQVISEYQGLEVRKGGHQQHKQQEALLYYYRNTLKILGRGNLPGLQIFTKSPLL